MFLVTKTAKGRSHAAGPFKPWDHEIKPSKQVSWRPTVFIQIDAHALIDAHPLHHQALGTRVKSIIFISKMQDLRPDVWLIMMQQLHVLHTLSVRLLE